VRVVAGTRVTRNGDAGEVVAALAAADRARWTTRGCDAGVGGLA
jgi:hypothetical protein